MGLSEINTFLTAAYLEAANMFIERIFREVHPARYFYINSVKGLSHIELKQVLVSSEAAMGTAIS